MHHGEGQYELQSFRKVLDSIGQPVIDSLASPTILDTQGTKRQDSGKCVFDSIYPCHKVFTIFNALTLSII